MPVAEKLALSKPIVASDESFRQFMVSSLRGASLRARLLTTEIDTIGTALKGGLISSDDAVRALDELDVWFLIPEMARQPQ